MTKPYHPDLYYPEYQPKDANRFALMEGVFAVAETEDELRRIELEFILDLSFARQDILVALGRAERAKGWR